MTSWMSRHCALGVILVGQPLLGRFTTRDGTVHVFVPNRHGMDILVRCMRPYDEYRQFTPNPEWGTQSNATLFDNCQRASRRTANAESCALENKAPLDSDHVLILNASLT